MNSQRRLVQIICLIGVSQLNRMELQQLSTERIDEAEVLLAASKWSGAYYLAGYSLECALKSCVLAYIERTGIIFQDKKYAEKCWTHNLEELFRQAGLLEELGTAIESNINLGKNWLIAKDWSEASRYQFKTQTLAVKLVKAITENTDGVLTWVKSFW